MADYKQMAQLLRAVACGANANEVCVLGDGIFFVNEKPARIFAEKHYKELVEIKETAPLGWLAKNKPGAADNYDPLIKVIEQALADAGPGGS